MSKFVKSINYNPKGGSVSVDIMIGQAQAGLYTVNLFDANGKNPEEVGNGNNVDDLPDTFEIKTPVAQLKSRLLGWTITIASPEEGPAKLYFARVTIRQDGQSLSDGPFEYSGPLDGAKIILGYGRFTTI